MAITKAHLIDLIYAKMDFQKQKATSAVESILEIIKHTLESGEDVLITGFGKFFVKEKKERKGRSPRTGEDMTLRYRRVVRFKHSGVLKEIMNTKK